MIPEIDDDLANHYLALFDVSIGAQLDRELRDISRAEAMRFVLSRFAQEVLDFIRIGLSNAVEPLDSLRWELNEEARRLRIKGVS